MRISRIRSNLNSRVFGRVLLLTTVAPWQLTGLFLLRLLIPQVPLLDHLLMIRWGILRPLLRNRLQVLCHHRASILSFKWCYYWLIHFQNYQLLWVKKAWIVKQNGQNLLEIPRNFVLGIFQLWHNFPFLLGRNHKIWIQMILLILLPMPPQMENYMLSCWSVWRVRLCRIFFHVHIFMLVVFYFFRSWFSPTIQRMCQRLLLLRQENLVSYQVSTHRVYW